MKTCFVYAADRVPDVQYLIETLGQHGFTDLPVIGPDAPRAEQQRLYQEAQAIGFFVSQGLKDCPLLSELVRTGTADARVQRKIVFPIFTTERGLFDELEEYGGPYLDNNATKEALKQALIASQIQRLIHLLEKEV